MSWKWIARCDAPIGAEPSPTSWMRFVRHDKPGVNGICANRGAAAVAKRFVFWPAHARERWLLAPVQSVI